MRIICPTCASHYEVEAERIAAQGQLVRCARCRDVWLVRSRERQAAASAPPGAPAVAPATAVTVSAAEIVDFKAARTRLRPRRKQADGREWATSIGLFAGAAMILAAAAGLHSFRTTIVARLPAAAGLYAALGFPGGANVLALQDVHSVMVAEGAETVLTLQAKIANTGDSPASVPNLTMVVRGDAQVPLYTWTAAAPKPMLARGESIDFHTRLASPPPAGRDVRVSFAEVAVLNGPVAPP